jgi:hypothetical protein
MEQYRKLTDRVMDRKKEKKKNRSQEIVNQHPP